MGVFLFFSLFFPRIALLIAYLSGGVPPNNVPLVFDVISFLFVPRILILYYIVYAELGLFWFIAHVIALLFSVLREFNKD